MLADVKTTEFKFQKANGSVFSGTKIPWNSLFHLSILPEWHKKRFMTISSVTSRHAARTILDT